MKKFLKNIKWRIHYFVFVRFVTMDITPGGIIMLSLMVGVFLIGLDFQLQVNRYAEQPEFVLETLEAHGLVLPTDTKAILDAVEPNSTLARQLATEYVGLHKITVRTYYMRMFVMSWVAFQYISVATGVGWDWIYDPGDFPFTGSPRQFNYNTDQ